MQQQRLAQEMQDAAVTGLVQKRPRMKASRSLPHMVLKPAPRTRVSLLTIVVGISPKYKSEIVLGILL